MRNQFAEITGKRESRDERADFATVPSNSHQEGLVPHVDASGASQLNPLDQMVSGQRLLQILWDEASRPSYRWLQYQCARRSIPFVRSSGRTWFVPREVRAALTKREVRRGRPPGR